MTGTIEGLARTDYKTTFINIRNEPVWLYVVDGLGRSFENTIEYLQGDVGLTLNETYEFMKTLPFVSVEEHERIMGYDA